jgi:hypothetical protein
MSHDCTTTPKECKAVSEHAAMMAGFRHGQATEIRTAVAATDEPRGALEGRAA